ncbi:MAG: ribose-phosphate diphosphokinase [Candidatus Micrarchaeota archaeon]
MAGEKLVLVSPNCRDLEIKGAEIDIKVFPDGENYIRIPEDCTNRDVVLFHRCYPDQDKSLIQLFLAIYQINEMHATKITAVVPYLAYARQDKRFLDGEAVSSHIIYGMLKTPGCDELVTLDCHFLKETGTFKYNGIRIVNLTMAEELLKYLKPKCKDPLVISPDEGARYLVEKEKDAGVMKKVRGTYKTVDGSSFREVEVHSMEFDVKDRDVIIIDDIISTGGTMIKAVKACKEHGANDVYCAATHGLFLKGSLDELYRVGAKEVVCSDSIPGRASKVQIKNVMSSIL